MNRGSLELKTIIKMKIIKLNHHDISVSITVSKNIYAVSLPLIYMVYLFCSYFLCCINALYIEFNIASAY